MATNANPAPTNLEVLWQEIEHQKKLTTDLSSQVQRVRRFARVDELEAVTGKLQSEETLIRTINSLTETVHVIADLRQRELSVDEEGQRYWLQNKALRSRQTAKHLAHYRYMSTLTQTRTDRCPCGRHQGIRFTTKDGTVVEENYCPLWWWIAMSRMALDSRKSAQFREKMPLTKWLEKYFVKAHVKS